MAQVEGIVQAYLNEAALPLLKEVTVPAAYMQRTLTPQQLQEYSTRMTLLGQDLGDLHVRYAQFAAGVRPNDPAELVDESISDVEAFMRQNKLDNPSRMSALRQLHELVQTEELANVVLARIDERGR